MGNKKRKHLTLDGSKGENGKGPSTISKEVRRNIIVLKRNVVRRDPSGNITDNTCSLLLKHLYVCNACPKSAFVQKIGKCIMGKSSRAIH